MSPQSPKELLQDTKDVQDAVVMGTNAHKLIISLCFVVLVLGIGTVVLKLQKSTDPQPIDRSAQASQPTPVVKTNTFLDSLVGTLLYLRDGKLYAMQLPDRLETQIVGLRPGEEVRSFPQVSPVWSRDGRYVAVMTDTEHAYVSEYDTGRFVGSFSFRGPHENQQSFSLSFDPADEILSLGTRSDLGLHDESIAFYSLFSQKEIGFYPRCSPSGVWLTGLGYVLRCEIGNSASVNLIRFEQTSSTMVPLTAERKGLSYHLIGEFGSGLALGLRVSGSTKDLVTISSRGVVSKVAPTFLPKGVSPEQFSTPSESLQKRIEETLHVSGVRRVSVSSSNDWLVYETDAGLWVNMLELKDPSYFIGPGTLPVIRPY